MNYYRCETCSKDHYCPIVHAADCVEKCDCWIKDVTSIIGCASHSEFKIDRDKVLSEWATCIHNCVHIHCLGKYNEIVAGYRKSDRDGE
jgi:hypothetical protein